MLKKMKILKVETKYMGSIDFVITLTEPWNGMTIVYPLNNFGRGIAPTKYYKSTREAIGVIKRIFKVQKCYFKEIDKKYTNLMMHNALPYYFRILDE